MSDANASNSKITVIAILLGYWLLAYAQSRLPRARHALHRR